MHGTSQGPANQPGLLILRAESATLESVKLSCPKFAVLLFFLAGPGFVRTTYGQEKISAPHLSVDLVAENQYIQPGRDFSLGLLFHLEKGWHVYWKNPGDSGSPPQVQWMLPAGCRAGAIQWPYPRRIAVGPLMNYGYEDEVLFIVPMHAAPQPKEGAAKIAAALKWVVCQEVCIAGKGDVSLELPISTAAPAPSPLHDLFAKTRALLPRPLPAKWQIKAVSFSDAFLLTARIGKPISSADFFPVDPLVIENAAPELFRNYGGKRFSLRLKKSEQLTKPVPRLKGVLVTDGAAYEAAIAVGGGPR